MSSEDQNRINQAVPHNHEPVPEQGKGKNLEDLTVRDTVFENFEAAPITVTESAVLDQKKAEIRDLYAKPEAEKKHGIRGFIAKPLGKVTVSVAGLLTAGAATFGTIAATSHGPEKTPPVASAPATPGNNHETDKPAPSNSPETLPTVESLELDPSLLSNPENLTKTFLEKDNTDWMNAGATPENAKAGLIQSRKDGSWDPYIEKIASEYDALYIEALLPDNWQSNPNFVIFVDQTKALHRQVLGFYFSTSFKDLTGDTVPYERSVKVYGVESSKTQSDGSVVIQALTGEMDNSAKNTIGTTPNTESAVVNPNDKVAPIMTFGVIDGKLKLTDVLLGEHVSQ